MHSVAGGDTGGWVDDLCTLHTGVMWGTCSCAQTYTSRYVASVLLASYHGDRSKEYTLHPSQPIDLWVWGTCVHHNINCVGVSKQAWNKEKVKLLLLVTRLYTGVRTHLAVYQCINHILHECILPQATGD